MITRQTSRSFDGLVELFYIIHTRSINNHFPCEPGVTNFSLILLSCLSVMCASSWDGPKLFISFLMPLMWRLPQRSESVVRMTVMAADERKDEVQWISLAMVGKEGHLTTKPLHQLSIMECTFLLLIFLHCCPVWEGTDWVKIWHAHTDMHIYWPHFQVNLG